MCVIRADNFSRRKKPAKFQGQRRISRGNLGTGGKIPSDTISRAGSAGRVELRTASKLAGYTRIAAFANAWRLRHLTERLMRRIVPQYPPPATPAPVPAKPAAPGK